MRYSTILHVRSARCIDAPGILKRTGILPAYRGSILKTLLNMRRAPHGNGTNGANGSAAHLHFPASSLRRTQTAQAAHVAAQGATPFEEPVADDNDTSAGIGDIPSTPTLRPVTPLHPVPTTPTTVSGRAVQVADVADVERMIESEQLVTFHVFRTFDYSVNLLFWPKELKFYVALFQDNRLWRALTTSDLNTSKQVFHHMQDQAARLADGELKRVQLEAQNETLKRAIAESEGQAERLRRGLQRTAVQDQAVNGKQHQLRKELTQLEAQRTAMQAQLNKTHRQVHQLNVQSNEALPHITR
jgi:hypothetical protein